MEIPCAAAFACRMCHYPLHGWRSRNLTPNGKRKIVFNLAHGFRDMPQTVECGKCIDCKLGLSRQWALRCMHESLAYEDNCFITLTYAPQYLPVGGTLVLEDWRYFIKKLRRKYPNRLIRYYHSGEYGGTATKRAHYHAIIFNLDFDDLVQFKTQNGIPLYTSETLTKIWGKGHCSVGRVTMDSVAYVARYIMKKQYPSKLPTAQAAYVENYERIDTDTGEIHNVKPEYSTMSRNIGKEWFLSNQGDCFPKDFVTFKGEKFKPPKFYDRLYSDLHPEQMEVIKKKRGSHNLTSKDNTDDRLRTRARVKTLQTARLIRPLGEHS